MAPRNGGIVDIEQDFGRQMSEHVIKKGLTELNPCIHFDMGARLGIQHPMMNIRQPVFYNGRHICSMDRGMIPEYQVCGMADRYDPETRTKTKVKSIVMRVGWRHTFEKLIKAQIPNVTRETLAKKFNVPIKFWTGEKETIGIYANG